MSKAKGNGEVVNMLTGDTAEPDYREKLAFFKAALVGYAGGIKRGKPQDELRRVFIENMAGLDKLFVHGSSDMVSRAMDAHTVKVLVSYHAYLLAYLTAQNMSDEEAEAMRRDIKEIKQLVNVLPRFMENYAEAMENPNETAKDMYRMVWGQMRSLAADIAKFLDENGWSQNKAAKHFRMSRNTIARIVKEEIIPAYSKARLSVPDPHKRSSAGGYYRDRNRGDVWKATEP